MSFLVNPIYSKPIVLQMGTAPEKRCLVIDVPELIWLSPGTMTLTACLWWFHCAVKSHIKNFIYFYTSIVLKPGAFRFLHPLYASRLLRPKETDQALFSCLESKFFEGCPLGRRM